MLERRVERLCDFITDCYPYLTYSGRIVDDDIGLNSPILNIEHPWPSSSGVGRLSRWMPPGIDRLSVRLSDREAET